MSTIHNLATIGRINKLGSNSTSLLRKAFSFNGTNGYIQQVGYSSGVVTKLNDGTRNYWQCYGGYFNIGDSAVHGLDNRSVQTMKFTFQIDDTLNTYTLASYNTHCSIEIVPTTGVVRLYLTGTGSIQISSTTALVPGQIYNVVVKINNSLPSGTARVVGDADIFINGVKEVKTSNTFTNNVNNTSILNWGGANATTNLFRGRLYNFSLWNRALSDDECQTEGASNWAVVTPSGLVNTRDTSNTSQAIARTGYNLNVAGSVTTGTDADGKYMSFLGSVGSMVSGSALAFSSISLSHSIKVRIKTGPSVGGIQRIYNNVISSSNRVSITIVSGELIVGVYNGTTYIGKRSKLVNTNTLYDIHYVWDSVTSTGKLYFGSVEETNVPAGIPSATGTAGFYLGGPSADFFTGYIYHARIRARALSQADINADIALGNNTNNDPTIVASYRPDNLINWQGINSPNDMLIWGKSGATTVTANTTLAPDGTTTADTVNISGTVDQGIEGPIITTLTGSSLASKTFIIKAFVKVASGTSQFRLGITHANVANYWSTNQTATTTWQEFTFTQTFTSSTAGTGIVPFIVNPTGVTNPSLQVRNVRLFLVNEILYDNSPNIGGYVGPLNNKYYSVWVKLGADGVDTAFSQPLLVGPYGFTHIRTWTNIAYVRVDNRVGSSGATYTLSAGNRNRKQLILGIEYEPNTQQFTGVIYDGGSYIGQTTFFKDASHTLTQAMIFAGRYATGYLNGNMRDLRFYTSLNKFTESDYRTIANGGEPSGAIKVLHRNSNNLTGNYVADQSGNGRVGYATGGVTIVRK